MTGPFQNMHKNTKTEEVFECLEQTYVSYVLQYPNGPETGVAFYCFLNITACMLCKENA